jgi:hypothetical protein
MATEIRKYLFLCGHEINEYEAAQANTGKREGTLVEKAYDERDFEQS